MLPKVDPVLARRMSFSLVKQAKEGQPRHHSMCYNDRKSGPFFDEKSSSSSSIASQSHKV